MIYSQTGLALTERFEGCKLQAYPDSTGIPTIGYGHTLGVQLGDTCTQEQAELWLASDMGNALDCVERERTVGLTQDEFDALVDFTFNVGCGAFANSTLLKLLNANDFAGAAAEFDKWDHAGGQVVAGLLRRRQAETALFQDDTGTTDQA